MSNSITRRMCGIGDEAAASLNGQLAAQRDAGMQALEIRTIDRRGLHELSDRQATTAAAAVASAGLVVPVVDTPIGGWAVSVKSDMRSELALLRRVAERARGFGCRRLRVMSYPNDGHAGPEWRREALRRMRLLVSAAADLDVLLLHENCQGWASRSAVETLDMLHELDSPHLRLVFDVGNGLTYGYEARAFLEVVLPWVDHVHVKDGVRRVGGEPHYTLPGAGGCGLAVCIEMLERFGYCGFYSIEPSLAYSPHDSFDAGAAHKADSYRVYAATFARLLAAVVGQMGGEVDEIGRRSPDVLLQ